MDIVGSDIDRLAEDLKNNPPKGLQEARDERKIRALSNKFIRQEVIDYIRRTYLSRTSHSQQHQALFPKSVKSTLHSIAR